MKLKIKLQEYQTEAVRAVTDVFRSQPHQDPNRYRTFLPKYTSSGRKEDKTLYDRPDQEIEGAGNAAVQLSDKQLLDNIREIQTRHGLPLSKSLSKESGAVQIDVEMETGTGKTYVYIKTIYELYRLYGWSKFIIVVPSIAIREGVRKSFETYESHFRDYYVPLFEREGREFQPIRYFVYDSDRLEELRTFGEAGLRVMIINAQAFNASFKEVKNNTASRIIYSRRDNFGSRKPIDAVADTRPIIIEDEPQRLEGKETQKGLKKFNPLFTLYFSATHLTVHNTVYALDPLDAYRKKLVKRIEVKAIHDAHNPGTSAYLYLQGIMLSPKEPPKARIELFVKSKAGTVSRKSVTLQQGDDLFIKSGELAAYKDLRVEEIDPGKGMMLITGGVELHPRRPIGNGQDEENIRRIQIRETIKSHLQKEQELFPRGIKVLSLFFIDHVADYRSYDEENNPLPGKLQEWFEEIYEEERERLLSMQLPEEYREYLLRDDPGRIHRGYFSIDKNGRSVDSKLKRGTDESSDPSDYDLILRDKEQLLSFDEPTRFIFSHSALREGWDNPNIFQICTLRPTTGEIQKRQSVGRGLRICVNKYGERQDLETLGEDAVHRINLLTVIANESYADFTRALQNDISANLRQRPSHADIAYLSQPLNIDGKRYQLSMSQVFKVQTYLVQNDYVDVDKDFVVTPNLEAAKAAGTFAPLPKSLEEVKPAVMALLKGLADPASLKYRVDQAGGTVINKTNDYFKNAEFQKLWASIRHKYYYTVHYDSGKLIEDAVKAIDERLSVRTLIYEVERGVQNAEKGDDFSVTTKSHEDNSRKVDASSPTGTKYDPVGAIASRTHLLRSTVTEILRRIGKEKFDLFRVNPEEFISGVSKLIMDQKRSSTFVRGLSYRKSERAYQSYIFTTSINPEASNYIESKEKHVTPYVEVDSDIERQFAAEVERQPEVTVYAKLPRAYKIPTPVGNYSPDWALVVRKGDENHLYLVVETKGTVEVDQLRPVEDTKIESAKKLFNEVISTCDFKVEYKQVRDYESLLSENTGTEGQRERNGGDACPAGSDGNKE